VRVWRVCARRHVAHALDGEGARRFGGRWNPPGVAVVYTAGSLALAILELLVQVDVDLLPDDLVALAVEVPDAVRVRRVRAAQLPAGWDRYPALDVAQAVGAAWVRAADSAVLAVPSAVVPQESNYLLNPAHPDARGIRAGRPERLRLDPRLPLRPARVSASRPPRRTS
jgi:RES domain-containing protein